MHFPERYFWTGYSCRWLWSRRIWRFRCHRSRHRERLLSTWLEKQEERCRKKITSQINQSRALYCTCASQSFTASEWRWTARWNQLSQQNISWQSVLHDRSVSMNNSIFVIVKQDVSGTQTEEQKNHVLEISFCNMAIKYLTWLHSINWETNVIETGWRWRWRVGMNTSATSRKLMRVTYRLAQWHDWWFGINNRWTWKTN